MAVNIEDGIVHLQSKKNPIKKFEKVTITIRIYKYQLKVTFIWGFEFAFFLDNDQFFKSANE